MTNDIKITVRIDIEQEGKDHCQHTHTSFSITEKELNENRQTAFFPNVIDTADFCLKSFLDEDDVKTPSRYLDEEENSKDAWNEMSKKEKDYFMLSTVGSEMDGSWLGREHPLSGGHDNEEAMQKWNEHLYWKSLGAMEWDINPTTNAKEPEDKMAVGVLSSLEEMNKVAKEQASISLPETLDRDILDFPECFVNHHIKERRYQEREILNQAQKEKDFEDALLNRWYKLWGVSEETQVPETNMRINFSWNEKVLETKNEMAEVLEDIVNSRTDDHPMKVGDITEMCIARCILEDGVERIKKDVDK